MIQKKETIYCVAVSQQKSQPNQDQLHPLERRPCIYALPEAFQGSSIIRPKLGLDAILSYK